MVELNFKPGDRVNFRLATEELEAQVLESPNSEIILVKLGSGYNIGLRKENILAARKLPDKNKEEIVSIVKERKQSNLPKIAVVVTGGTIASKIDYKTGAVAPINDPKEFLDLYPELENIAEVKSLVMPFKMLSGNMDSSHWIKIAETIKPLLEDPEIEGVIMTQGTDTLHYTGAALSFFFQNLNKPIVLTYSQKSIDRASSDARLNVLCAARTAISKCAEVLVVGHATESDDYCHAYRATKVKKLHSSKRAAFVPVNTSPIARVTANEIKFLSPCRARNDSKVELDVAFTDKIALLKVYPGQDPSILDYYALSYKGIVIEGTGLGHIPASGSNKSWIPALKKHIRNGLVVCLTTQTNFGRVDPYVYSYGRELLDAGIVFLEDMLPETAFVKLGFVLGHHGWKTKVKEKMLENVAGELQPFQSL
jgi:glutamyl-tRNA(Gln) amidotransferase subunit D